MVQSARVQEIVKGDDTTQTHQIMESVAFNAELSRAPVQVQALDIATFFYPMQDPTLQDLIGFVGVAVGSYPTSTFTVFTPGVIPAVLNGPPQRGTSVFQSGLGRTVRAEVSKFVAAVTGNITIGLNTISNLSSTVGLYVGAQISGPDIPAGSLITSLSGSSATFNNLATATVVGEALRIGSLETYYSIDEVDVYERGFPTSLSDTSGGTNPPAPNLDLT